MGVTHRRPTHFQSSASLVVKQEAYLTLNLRDGIYDNQHVSRPKRYDGDHYALKTEPKSEEVIDTFQTGLGPFDPGFHERRLCW